MRGLVVCILVGAAATPTSADIFHLKSGGTIEGTIADETDEHYKIETIVGEVRVAKESVERIEAAPTVLDEYAHKRAESPDTPEGHAALAEWCALNELTSQRNKHLRRAIELDTNYAPARRALGYVRIGPIWVEGSKVVERKPDEAEAEKEDPQELARQAQAKWRRRISAIRHALLDSGSDRLFEQGVEQIRQINDPLAILPLSEILSRGNLATRKLLVETLGRFREAEATLNLGIIGLVDSSESIRRLAVSELVKRDDPRIVAQYREALEQRNDILIRRAAYGLEQLGATAAIPDLIRVLKVRRKGWYEVPVRGYFRRCARIFHEQTVVTLGGVRQGVHVPRVGIWNPTSAVGPDVKNEWRYGPVTVYRTEVREALRGITDQDFGFERDQWWRWYQEAYQ